MKRTNRKPRTEPEITTATGHLTLLYFTYPIIRIWEILNWKRRGRKISMRKAWRYQKQAMKLFLPPELRWGQ